MALSHVQTGKGDTAGVSLGIPPSTCLLMSGREGGSGSDSPPRGWKPWGVSSALPLPPACGVGQGSVAALCPSPAPRVAGRGLCLLVPGGLQSQGAVGAYSEAPSGAPEAGAGRGAQCAMSYHRLAFFLSLPSLCSLVIAKCYRKQASSIRTADNVLLLSGPGCLELVAGWVG